MHTLAPRPALPFLQSLTLAALMAVAALCAVLAGTEAASRTSAPAAAKSAPGYGQVPLTFVPNRGQAGAKTLYQARGNGIGVAFGKRGVALSLGGGASTSALSAPMVGQTGGGTLSALAGDPSARLELGFRGADPDPAVTASRPQGGRVNYLVGDDPSRWQRDLPTFSQVSYAGLWQGVDMHFRGEPGNLKYEFSVAPGADPARIALSYAGASGLSVAGDGALQVATARGTLRDSAPAAWQVVDGRRVPVEARYRLDGGIGYGFTLGAYDRARPLVVDPGLEYSTYLGGPEGDQANDVAVDASGAAYVTGNAGSASFPVTQGVAQGTGSYGDSFVTKIAPDGASLVYSTYLGGASALDYAYGIEVDGNGNAYVGGYTESSNFPTTGGALSTSRKGPSDNFVTKLNPAGTGFVYSTYLGGSGNEGGQGGGLAIDGNGAAYYGGTTYSTDLATAGAPDSTGDAAKGDGYVAKLDPAGSALAYATYAGGTGQDYGNAVAVGSDGSAYLGGGTSGTDFPTTAGVVDSSNDDDSGYSSNRTDAFVTKVNPTGTVFGYSTLLGNNGSESVDSLAVDGDGAAYVGGITYGNFPTTAGAFDTGPNTNVSGFVTKLAPNATSLVWSSLLRSPSGSPVFIQGLELGPDKTPYVTGDTYSPPDFPTTAGAYDTSANGDTDGFFTKFAADGGSLVYSTLFGGGSGDNPKGLDVDPGGKAYIAGWTYSSGQKPFPTTPGAFQTTKNPSGYNTSSTYDAFALKLDPGVPPQCSNDLDDDGDGLEDFPNDTGCTSADDDTEYTAPPASSGGGAAPVSPVARPVTPSAAPPSGVACGRRVISLVRADKQGAKVKVSGLVGTGLVGKTVTVTGNYKLKGKTVRKTVKADGKGRFTATVNGPPARLFSKARYSAASGSAKSIELKLFQAMATSSIRQKSGRITMSGTIRKSLLGKRNPVLIRRLLCGKYRTVASVKPSARGRYSVSFTAPREAGAALYRAESTLLVRKGSRKYAPAFARAVSITLTGSTG